MSLAAGWMGSAGDAGARPGRARRAALTVASSWAALALASCGTNEGTAKSDTATTADSAVVDAADAETPDVVDTEVEAPDVRWTGKCAAGPSFCDDGNPCTDDRCDPLTGCYVEPVDCADDDPCTLDLCDTTGKGCTHSENTCDDGNVCTEGSCQGAIGCAYTVVPCSDGDACTSDGCSPVTGCLNAKLNCDDNITCTVDSCDPTNGCSHVAPAGALCCETVADCDDDNVCTNHACKAGVCVNVPVFGCCKANTDCDDGNPCTQDTCAVAAGVCSNAYLPGPGCCQQHVECDDGDLCTFDRCAAGQCGHEAQCCSKAQDCWAGTTADPCVSPLCVGGECALQLAKADVACCQSDLGQTGFETTDALAFDLTPSKNAMFTITAGPASDVHSGGASLRYEVSVAEQAGGKALATAMLPVQTLPSGTSPVLTFWTRSQMSGGTTADTLRLRADTSIGSFYLWQAPANQGWTKVTISLRGFAGRASTRTLRLVFEGKPGSSVWAGSKAFFDDLAIVTSCANATCNVAADCDDGLGATSDSCVQGLCSYEVGKGYCEQASTCNDGKTCTIDTCGSNFDCSHVDIPDCCTKTLDCQDADPCTTDTCSGTKCKHTKLPGSVCCNGVADCDDSNPCTVDSCPVVGLACQSTQTDPTCCVGAKDCDDGKPCTFETCVKNVCGYKEQCCAADADCGDADECTSDVCVGGFCTWSPIQKPGCCVPDVVKQGFEENSTEPLVLQSELATSKWQLVSGAEAKSGKGALYYGNLAKGNFDDGQSSGQLRWKGVELVAGESYQISLWLWMDTEAGTTYDAFEVQVTVGGKTLKLWDKNDPAFTLKTWSEVKVDLSAFAGKTIDIVLEFRTTDSVANNGVGVYVDDLHLTRSCAAKVCNTPADCDDKISLTAETCTSGLCAYTY